MGKVLSTFQHGFAGAIGRNLDDVVVALANKSGEAIPFGTPVVLSSDQTGVIPFDGDTHTADDFVGVTVRNPSKTPDTYGSDTADYAANDIVDVLTRGHIVVELDASGAKMGDAVAIDKSTGGFTTGTGNTVVPLTNVHLSAAPDSLGMAEILVNTRNIL